LCFGPASGWLAGTETESHGSDPEEESCDLEASVDFQRLVDVLNSYIIYRCAVASHLFIGRYNWAVKK
jgi:hypothetical protein